MDMTNPIMLALLGGLFTWGMTALGAAMVFFFKEISPKVSNLMMGFAAGIMIAASFWSLLLPAMELCENNIDMTVNMVGGFAAGAFFLYFADRLMNQVIKKAGAGKKQNGGLHMTSIPIRRSLLLILAITIHNMPEGLSFGVAYGNAAAGATALALGIGLQNFPEGAAVAIPLRREGYSRGKCFFYGQASAIVEPLAAVFGAWLASSLVTILPFTLTFAAGAMIYVVVEELIPDMAQGKHSDWGVVAFSIGFVIMMILDVALS